jgi:adenylate kinase family enzyme
MSMVKIYIMGIVASGKTTYAKDLSKSLNIPFIELDSVVYKKVNNERIKQSPEQQVEFIREVDEEGAWIFEGVYRPSYHIVLDLADVIIWLDPPLFKRKYRILRRHIKQVLGIEQCAYKPTFLMLRNMYKWTSDFERKRPLLNEILKPYEHKLIFVTSNPYQNQELRKIVEKL